MIVAATSVERRSSTPLHNSSASMTSATMASGAVINCSARTKSLSKVTTAGATGATGAATAGGTGAAGAGAGGDIAAAVASGSEPDAAGGAA